MKVTKEVGLRNVVVGVDTRDVGGASGVIVVESQPGHALLQFEENDVEMLSGNMSDEAGITREGGDEGCYVGRMREDDVEFSPGEWDYFDSETLSAYTERRSSVGYVVEVSRRDVSVSSHLTSLFD